MQQFDVIIVGGGLAGASLALALRHTRLKIALVESRPPEQPAGWDARVYAVSPANVVFLDEIGAWKHLAVDRMQAVGGMEVFGDLAGKIEFSAYETGVSELSWILESSLMALEFWESIKRQANVTLFCPDRPESLRLTELTAELSLVSGEVLVAPLMVAADGRDSWVRQSAGLVAQDTHYHDKGVVANFETELPHRGVAYQWFGKDGILAYLPLPGQRMSMVWSTPDAHADALCALPPALFCEQVEAAAGGRLGKLSLLTPPAAFPLRLMRVPQTVMPRLALVGDAAHGIHPLSGHGINLGFQDVKVLAELLAQAPVWQDIGDLRFLQRYQRARREETLLMQTTTNALRQLFRFELPGVAGIRNLGMDVTNRLPLLKNALVRYALGAL